MRSTIAKTAVAAASGLLLVSGLAACGSDDEGSTSSNQNFTGDPVTVMTLAPVGTAAINTPEVITAAEAAVKTINDAGGLGGHEVKLIACNDGNDPNKAGQCAREAVEKKAIAVLGGFTTNGSTIVPILENADIPWIGGPGFSAEELASKVSYPLVAGAVAFTGIGARMVEDGCTSTSTVLYDVPTAEKAAQLIDAGLAAKGADGADHIKVPTTTTDFSSVAKSAAESDCAVIGLPNDQVVALATAAETLGEDTQYYALQGALNHEVLSSAGKALEGATSAVNFVVASNKAWDEAKASSDDVDWTYPYNQNTWASYQVLKEVLGTQTDVTAASVVASLAKASEVKIGGLTAPINFTKEFPVPGLNRVFNPQVFFVKAENGEVVQVGDVTDITALFGG